jgi:saccharopine dehydrogenase (NAD+, L-glutamate forming)
MSYRDFVNSFFATLQILLKLNTIDLKIDQDDIMWDKLLELDLFNKIK